MTETWDGWEPHEFVESEFGDACATCGVNFALHAAIDVPLRKDCGDTDHQQTEFGPCCQRMVDEYVVTDAERALFAEKQRQAAAARNRLIADVAGVDHAAATRLGYPTAAENVGPELASWGSTGFVVMGGPVTDHESGPTSDGASE